jgi:hypothetical protein
MPFLSAEATRVDSEVSRHRSTQTDAIQVPEMARKSGKAFFAKAVGCLD